jgi:hypothetical protein
VGLPPRQKVGEMWKIVRELRDSTCHLMAREVLLIYWYKGGSVYTKASHKGERENDPITDGYVVHQLGVMERQR